MDIAELAEGQILAVGRGDEQVADGVFVFAERLLHAHHQIELALALNDLRGRLAADGRVHDVVNVAYVETVARELLAVGCDDETRLAGLADDGDFGDARSVGENVFDLGSLGGQQVEIGAVDLYRQRALQAGFRFVDGVFSGLSVVEDNAGEGVELLLDRLDEARLGMDFAVPGGVVIRLEADVEFVVEEAGGIGAVVGAAKLVGDRGHLRKAEQNIANLRAKALRPLRKRWYREW